MYRNVNERGRCLGTRLGCQGNERELLIIDTNIGVLYYLFLVTSVSTQPTHAHLHFDIPTVCMRGCTLLCLRYYTPGKTCMRYIIITMNQHHFTATKHSPY